MSFILDALRRAETRRGTQAPVPVADSTLGQVAEKSSSLPPLRWIIGLAFAAVAIGVLAMNVLELRSTSTLAGSHTPDQPPAAPTQPTTFSAISPNTSLSDVIQPGEREVRPLAREARVNTAPKNEPVVQSAPAAVRPGTVTVSQQRLSPTETPSRVMTNVPDNDTSVLSYKEAVLGGRGQVPEFHLDIHVYASAPDRRFVFVNNRKYREGDELNEGGSVERITPVGVILNHRGRRFELVPE